jgi:hypothetical protein
MAVLLRGSSVESGAGEGFVEAPGRGAAGEADGEAAGEGGEAGDDPLGGGFGEGGRV